MKKIEPYPIEIAFGKVLREVAIFIKRGGKFFFEIPEDKMDKYIYVMETLSWILLTMALIFKIGGR